MDADPGFAGGDRADHIDLSRLRQGMPCQPDSSASSVTMAFASARRHSTFARIFVGGTREGRAPGPGLSFSWLHAIRVPAAGVYPLTGFNPPPSTYLPPGVYPSPQAHPPHYANKPLPLKQRSGPSFAKRWLIAFY
ncbi:hypothetical protein HPP92_028058 [Vanilla planifolia]|uniref:Uncharacterized protein n=1 Tax=Vanilla planifolia TaxID=51239 RepID=A0A835P9G5_VANPL|nr:hypothetical protein HPP92_028058 [Vanilla planifolia]